MESNVPATTEQPAVPATTDQAAVPSIPQQPPPKPGQNVATGLFPLALGLLVLAFLALAFWTLMAATGSGL
ncbi:MAG: hypothetical protein M3537_11005 [Chloroflexota bacterium]|nr:hypothetical protein [Chloroflexota bacterium]